MADATTQFCRREEIKVAEDILVEEVKKGEFCLVGKLHLYRVIVRDVTLKTMQIGWRTSKAFEINTINPNLFVITFESLDDKRRVLSGCPWLFDNSLFSLKVFDGYTPPVKIVFDNDIFWIQMHHLPLACLKHCVG